jgi:hypothetical protein
MFQMETAADAWQSALHHAAARRADAPLDTAENAKRRRARTVRGLVRRALRPGSYLATVRILRAEGLAGLRRRLRVIR